MSYDELDTVLVALQVADHERIANDCRQHPIWNLSPWLSEKLATLAVPFPVEASHATDYGVWFTSSAMTYAVGIVRRRVEYRQTEQYCSTYLINADKLPTPSAEACEAYLRMVIDKFLLSEQGKQAYEKTCQDFNWGDVETEIPKDFWAAFGITPCDNGRPFLGCGIIAILVDQDELLGKNLYD